MSEKLVSVAVLKARLSEFLRNVRAGETVVVTDRGQPVARLTPLEGVPALAGRLQELVAAGLVRRPLRAPDAAEADVNRPADPEGRSLGGVLEERAEGW
jgi:prevent-host-death family protein